MINYWFFKDHLGLLMILIIIKLNFSEDEEINVKDYIN